jgi:glycosyltransferase involved in cell wall biosynthesis
MSRMNLLYVHNDQLGYGRLGVKLAAAVKRAGVEIFDDLPNPMGSDAQKFIPHTNGRTGVCSHASWVSTPGHYRGRWKGQSASLLSMWESNLLPEPFRESLDVFDTIVVPSEQNQELFSRYHDNVKFVPLGIDPEEWFPMERPKYEAENFTFLISGGGHRKGSDLVIDAFLKVFDGRVPDGPRPRLFIHSAKASEFPRDDRIHLITGKLNPEEERALYNLAHCYVQPSRGEGFGLRPLQAMAQGCPTIATNAHGHAAFGDLITYPLGWSLLETPPQAFHHGPAGSWWEPNFDDLCEAMEDVYLNYDKAVRKAAINAHVVTTKFTWDETARKYLDAIGRENLEGDDVPQDEWIEPTARRYLVRVVTPRFFEVGGLQYMLEPGKDYWEPADVKRVLFDGGHLDLSCLPQNMIVNGDAEDGAPNMVLLESGLTPDQFEKIPDYTGSHSLCVTCHQRLNTNMPTLEEIEALPTPVESAWQL